MARKNKIYLDYPENKIGDKLDGIFTFLTYLSIVTVIVSSYFLPGDKYFYIFLILELIFSLFFLIDYLYRMSLSRFSRKFILNPYSIADILSFLPIILIIVFNIGRNVQLLTLFRITRILRLFKVGKYAKFLKIFWKSFNNSLYKYKILGTFFILVWLGAGFLMYGLETNTNSYFTNIPKTMLWFIGHGDGENIMPITKYGKYLYYISTFFSPIFFSLFTSTTIVVILDVVKTLRGDESENLCENCKRDLTKKEDEE